MAPGVDGACFSARLEATLTVPASASAQSMSEIPSVAGGLKVGTKVKTITSLSEMTESSTMPLESASLMSASKAACSAAVGPVRSDAEIEIGAVARVRLPL